MASKTGVALVSILALAGISALAYYAFWQGNSTSQTDEDNYNAKAIFKEEEVKTIDSFTTVGVLQAILLRKNILDYSPRVLYTENELFQGSPEIRIKTKEITTPDNKKLEILDMEEDAQAFKNACIKALEETPDTEVEKIGKLKEWCTVPKVKDELKNRGFEVVTELDHYRKVRANSRWLVDENGGISEYARKVAILQKHDFDPKILSGNPDTKAYRLYIRCIVNWNTDYSITTIPASKLEDLDSFQRTTLFCVTPITAEKYLADQYQINDFHEIDHAKDKDHFCYVEGKNIDYYKQFKTTDNMGDKTFWCAVRFLYDKRKTANSSLAYR